MKCDGDGTSRVVPCCTAGLVATGRMDRRRGKWADTSAACLCYTLCTLSNLVLGLQPFHMVGGAYQHSTCHPIYHTASKSPQLTSFQAPRSQSHEQLELGHQGGRNRGLRGRISQDYPTWAPAREFASNKLGLSLGHWRRGTPLFMPPSGRYLRRGSRLSSTIPNGGQSFLQQALPLRCAWAKSPVDEPSNICSWLEQTSSAGVPV